MSAAAPMPRWNGVALSARDLCRRAHARDGGTGLCDVSLDVLVGQVTALMGPAGSGKSALLRVLAGVEPAEGGTLAAPAGDGGVALVQPPRREGGVARALARLARSERGSAAPSATGRTFENLPEALASRPSIVLADELGAGCWSGEEQERVGRLRDWVADGRRSALVVTADPLAAAHADRVVFMRGGSVVVDLERPDPGEVLSVVAAAR